MNDEMKRLIDLDIETIEEKPLTDLQKQKIRQGIHAKRSPKRAFKKWIAVAAVSFCALTGSYFALPTIASQVPFIENVLTKIDPNFVPQNYVNLATVIHQVQSNNGIDMMIENAVYDGNTLMMTYAIQTEHDLGEYPSIRTMLDIKGSNAATGTSSLEKVADGLYTGMIKVTPFFKKDQGESIQISWQPEVVTNSETNEQFTGDWSFAFTMAALPVTTQQVTAKSEMADAVLSVQQIDYTDLTAVVHYEFDLDPAVMTQYPLSSIDIVKVTDNFGTEHEIHGNGGAISDDGHGFDWSLALYTLTDDVTSITLTPEIYYVKESGEITADMRKLMEPFTIELDK